jgi:hypothetical protein
MKYSLRSLMIVAEACPPAVALLYFSSSLIDFAARLIIVGWASIFLFMAAIALPASE